VGVVCYDKESNDGGIMRGDTILTKVKMWCLTIRIKKNDQIHGKRLYNVLLDFMMGAGTSGATVINGVDGFGRRGKNLPYV